MGVDFFILMNKDGLLKFTKYCNAKFCQEPFEPKDKQERQHKKAHS